MKPGTILISRTDSIGDVILTLPVCAWLKKQFPDCKLIFLGNAYTRPVLECFPAIDEIVEWKNLESKSPAEQVNFIRSLKIDTCVHVFPKKEIARLMKKAKVPNRIGTSHRLFHLFTCNIRPDFTRKKSDLHESQLNFKLFEYFGVTAIPSLEEIRELLSVFKAKEQNLPVMLSEGKKVILHPKSQGSALEWPIEKYVELAQKLAEEGQNVYFTGTEKEGELFRDKIPQHPNIKDVTGKFLLPEFIYFISKCDAIVACSTGPLHIGAVLGLKVVGIYSQTRPIHPGRWRPVGERVFVLTNSKEPTEGKISTEYIKQIAVESVFGVVR